VGVGYYCGAGSGDVRVSQYSTNCSRSIHSLSAPSRATSRDPLMGAAAAISRGTHCQLPRTHRSPSCTHTSCTQHSRHTSHTHLSPLALTSHLSLALTSYSHSPLTSHSHCSSEPATRNATPPNPQHLRTRNAARPILPRSAVSRSLRAPLTSEPATPKTLILRLLGLAQVRLLAKTLPHSSGHPSAT
jgi:hypothetical protein